MGTELHTNITKFLAESQKKKKKKMKKKKGFKSIYVCSKATFVSLSLDRFHKLQNPYIIRVRVPIIQLIGSHPTFNVLLQNIVYNWVYILVNIFEKEWETILDCQL